MGTESQPLLPSAGQTAELPPASIRTELEKQRQTSARLLQDMAAAITRSAGNVRRRADSAARRTGQAAQYVQERYVREMVTGAGRVIRRHPAASLTAVVLAGFLIGRSLARR
jgi:ElaB/YqjD/DUF883 family membrane-anchored ribosome-binding protein